MRVKLVSLLQTVVYVGITPAHAGKTTPAREVKTVVEDHPRACG